MVDLSSPVSAPSAFYTLVPLALNVMLQPCGSVCGFHPRLKTYLRSSPFVCVADTFAMVIHFAVHLVETRSPTRAAQQVLQTRSQELDHGGVDGPTLARLQTFIRLLAFFWGLLPQVIKLFTSTGIRWTIAAASLYLASFIAFELVRLLGGESHLSRYYPLVHEKNLRTSKPSRFLDSVTSTCAFCAHFAFLIWAVFDLIYADDRTQMWQVFTPGFYMAIMLLYVGSLLALLSPALIIGNLVERYSKRLGEQVGGWLLMLTIVGIVYGQIRSNFVTRSLVGLGAWFPHAMKMGFVFNAALILFFLFMVMVYITECLSCYEVWREQVLFLHESAHTADELKPHEAARQTFSFALLTLVVTMTWYMLRYDGTGTSKPQWTSWLG